MLLMQMLSASIWNLIPLFSPSYFLPLSSQDTSVLSPLLIIFFQVPVIFLYTFDSPEPLNQYCLLFFTAMVFPMVKSCIQMVVRMYI